MLSHCTLTRRCLKNAHSLIYKCKTVTIVTKTTDEGTRRNEIRKEFKIFKELTRCGTGTPSEYMMLGNDAIDVVNAWLP